MHPVHDGPPVTRGTKQTGRQLRRGVVDEPPIAEQVGAGQHSRVAGVIRRIRVLAEYAVLDRCHLVFGVHLAHKGEDLRGVGSNCSPQSGAQIALSESKQCSLRAHGHLFSGGDDHADYDQLTRNNCREMDRCRPRLR